MGLPLLPFKTHRTGSGWQAWAACLLLGAGCVVSAHPARAANPSVFAVYTKSGNLFNYNFTVVNPTAFTLADVNVSFPTGAGATGLSAPTGFQIVFDPNGNGPSMGIVDFLADSNPATPQDFFSGTSTSGFLLTTTAVLNGAVFNTLDVNANSFSAPVTTSAAAPEPGALGLLAFGATPAAAGLLALRRRRRASRRSGVTVSDSSKG